MSNASPSTQTITFEDNSILPLLYGEQNHVLHEIEEALSIEISTRGAKAELRGEMDAVKQGMALLETLYARFEQAAARKQTVSTQEVKVLIAQGARQGEGTSAPSSPTKVKEALQTLDEVVIPTAKKYITPYTPQQASYMQALLTHDIILGAGPAGTGKTYLAVAAGVAMLIEGKVDRLILSRPAVEAGEQLGFLPGDLKEKVDPYLRPLYDALYDMLPGDRVNRYLATNVIEIAPLAFMRGRTLSRAFVILDEAQNTTPAQMKMFLTRLGEGAHMVLTGDLSQTDLPSSMKSGFRDAIEKLSTIEEVAIVHFKRGDIIRHPLTAKIVEAYDKMDGNSKWDES